METFFTLEEFFSLDGQELVQPGDGPLLDPLPLPTPESLFVPVPVQEGELEAEPIVDLSKYPFPMADWELEPFGDQELSFCPSEEIKSDPETSGDSNVDTFFKVSWEDLFDDSFRRQLLEDEDTDEKSTLQQTVAGPQPETSSSVTSAGGPTDSPTRGGSHFCTGPTRKVKVPRRKSAGDKKKQHANANGD